MGKDKQMAEYLCETCKHRKGKLVVYHRIDSQRIDCSYTNVVQVNCTESKKHPGMVKAAPKRPAWMEPTSVCPGYRNRGK
jgi:hypothetical protein